MISNEFDHIVMHVLNTVQFNAQGVSVGVCLTTLANDAYANLVKNKSDL